MTKKLIMTAIASLFIELVLISCGGGGSSGSVTGEGGYDLSDTSNLITSGSTLATNIDASNLAGDVSGDTSLTTLTTSGDTGTTSGDGTSGTGDTTDSLLGSGGDTTTSGGTGTSGTGTGSGDGTTNTGTTTGSGTGTTNTGTTTGSGTGNTNTGTVDASSIIDAGSDASFSIDITGGSWFVQEGETILSSSAASEAAAKIKSLNQKMVDIIKSFREGKITRDEAKDQIAAIRKEIKEIQKTYGNGVSTKSGIYADLQEQNMTLTINETESGWFRLTISAMNHGTLPADYDTFIIAVVNKDTGEEIGTIKIPASDKVYNSGAIEFQMENPKGANLSLVWKNDAYVSGGGNAALNISGISLKRIDSGTMTSTPTGKLSGDEFSVVDGRWFAYKGNAYTCWSDQTVGYTFKNLEAGTYEVTIQASNYGSLPLPDGYKYFKVDLDSAYDSSSIQIPAKSNGLSKETVKMVFPQGDTTLYLTWLNDQYKEGVYDTNLMIKSISIKKVKSSSLTAFLIQSKPGNRIFIISILAVISGVLLIMYLANRKKLA